MHITHGNLSQAAKMLGINRTTLYSRIQLQDEVTK
jgi:DNA-binding protein Fis